MQKKLFSRITELLHLLMYTCILVSVNLPATWVKVECICNTTAYRTSKSVISENPITLQPYLQSSYWEQSIARLKKQQHSHQANFLLQYGISRNSLHARPYQYYYIIAHKVQYTVCITLRLLYTH